MRSSNYHWELCILFQIQSVSFCAVYVLQHARLSQSMLQTYMCVYVFYKKNSFNIIRIAKHQKRWK